MQAVELKKEVKTGGRVVVLENIAIDILHAVSEMRRHRSLLFGVTFFNNVEQFRRSFIEDADGREVVHFIHSPEVVEALRSAGVPLPKEPAKNPYRPTPGDRIYIAARRRADRPATPQDLILAKLVY